ncbi:hypothetical protein NKJ55_31515 [Mesorhizobium sp. M0106]|uniref:hypothetical protein n=1 Tax=Mesorhizobium sp. M0106 TaxID=2956880 RepID=UPI00333BC615
MLLTSSDYRRFDELDEALPLRFGRPEDWPSLVATKLFDGEWFPVCSPAFLVLYPAVASENPKAFLDVPVLHLTTQPGAVDSWESWIGTERELDGLRFTSFLSMMVRPSRGAALPSPGRATLRSTFG